MAEKVPENFAENAVTQMSDEDWKLRAQLISCLKATADQGVFTPDDCAGR